MRPAPTARGRFFMSTLTCLPHLPDKDHFFLPGQGFDLDILHGSAVYPLLPDVWPRNGSLPVDQVADARQPRWQEGNTTARTVERLARPLVAWREDGLIGEPGTTADRLAWERYAMLSLQSRGISSAKDAEQGRNSLPGKILHALETYGMVRGRLYLADRPFRLAEWNEQAGLITPAGCRLADAWSRGDKQTLQIAFANALALRTLPSPLEPEWRGEAVSPIGLVAAVLLGLRARGRNEAFLTAEELATYVQCSSGLSLVEEIVAGVLGFRAAKTDHPDRDLFKKAVLASAGAESGVQPASLLSYANVLLNYYEATGVFRRQKQSRATVLRLAEEDGCLEMARVLASRRYPGRVPTDPFAYAEALESGEFSWRQVARPVLTGEVMPDGDRVVRAMRRNLEMAVAGVKLLATVRRMPADDPDTLAREEQAASDPAAWWPMVRSCLMDLMDGNDPGIDGIKPSALMEWCLFWSMLLLAGPSSLVTPVARARRFQIASDLLPVATATGGAADMELRFGSLAMTGEATLTTGSRQFASEGEAVSRHTAELVRRRPQGVRVLSLFVAPSVDENAAAWFARGLHWLGGSEHAVDIVPLSVDQLIVLGDAAARRGGGTVDTLASFCDLALAGRCCGTPAWLASIADAVSQVREAAGRSGVAFLPEGTERSLDLPTTAAMPGVGRQGNLLDGLLGQRMDVPVTVPRMRAAA